MREKEKIIRAIVRFAGHTVAGVAMFMIFGSSAVAMALLVKALSFTCVDPFVIDVLTFVEHSILIIDAILFLIYMIVMAIRFFKEM